MNRKKKQAAAVSAVLAYIRTEEAQRIPPGVMSPPAMAMPNIWGISGRQSQMHLRSMMQLKGFHGARLR